jgi:hypothetical protein
MDQAQAFLVSPPLAGAGLIKLLEVTVLAEEDTQMEIMPPFRERPAKGQAEAPPPLRALLVAVVVARVLLVIQAAQRVMVTAAMELSRQLLVLP